MSQNFYIPNHMSAIVTTGNGGFEKLSYKTVKTPVINKNEVLVKVLAAGINNTDINFITREEDIFCWEFSNKGFFNFKKNIPDILKKFSN